MSELLDAAQVKTKRARPRGTGSVYQQQRSANWWIQYYRNGKVYRQSAGTPKRREAEKLLQKKLGEIATHNFIEPRSEKILVKELADDLLREYKINNRKSLDDLKTRWEKHLANSAIFARRMSATITSRATSQNASRKRRRTRRSTESSLR